MVAAEKVLPASLRLEMLAPCGMDCGLCYSYFRPRNRCAGCNGDDGSKPRYCVLCAIKNCPERRGDFCGGCATYPCARLRRLDSRYRKKYGMSMLENLRYIAAHGPEAFLALEKERWQCADCGGLVCVHRESCVHCGRARDQAGPA